MRPAYDEIRLLGEPHTLWSPFVAKIQNYLRQRYIQCTCALKRLTLESDGLASPEKLFSVFLCLTFEVQISPLSLSQRLFAIVTGVEKTLSWNIGKWDMERQNMWFVKITEILSWESGTMEIASNQNWKLTPFAKLINILPRRSVNVTGQTQKRHPSLEQENGKLDVGNEAYSILHIYDFPIIFTIF